jgi:hypothetical protein
MGYERYDRLPISVNLQTAIFRPFVTRTSKPRPTLGPGVEYCGVKNLYLGIVGPVDVLELHAVLALEFLDEMTVPPQPGAEGQQVAARDSWLAQGPAVVLVNRSHRQVPPGQVGRQPPAATPAGLGLGDGAAVGAGPFLEEAVQVAVGGLLAARLKGAAGGGFGCWPGYPENFGRFPTFRENVSSASSITLNLSTLEETIDG